MSRYRILSAGLLALTLLLAAGVASGQGTVAPIPGWGQPIDPDGDCRIHLDGADLVIEVPSTPHTLRGYPHPRNAPRVLRDIESNWTATVKVSAELDLGDAPAGAAAEPPSQSAGLVLWLDDLNFVRLARHAQPKPDGEGAFHTVLFEYTRDGQRQTPPPAPDGPVLDGPAAWLRLTRHIDKVKAEYSADGETWTELGTLTARFPSRLRLGPVVTTTAPSPLTARFADFQFKFIPLYP